MPRENAIYRAHLASAGSLATELRGRNWTVLDELSALAATGNDPAAGQILDVLRTAARRDEHEMALAAPLRQADQAALDPDHVQVEGVQWGFRRRRRFRSAAPPRAYVFPAGTGR